ncbi:hypothetical protein BD410DRAFT_897009 [Rickenella mellea]|uniref:Uncharacterized protein n=1 Tax=Rickenella mellea TaxID=50990 RepID=A0A4Y7QBV3_9AGAM|nr:hypothetical protein BD410DRAFT_897009 [Rickenella mellea]
MLLPCSPPFRCSRATLPGGALPIVTQASHLTDSYLDSLFAPYEGCDPGLDPDHIDGKRAELDSLDHQIGIARIQMETLRHSLERARKKHAELEVRHNEVLAAANHLVGPALALAHSHGTPVSNQLFGTKSASNLPAEILLKIFSFLHKSLELDPYQLSLRRDKALTTYFHFASIASPWEIDVTPLDTQEGMQYLQEELVLAESAGYKFAVQISPSLKGSNFDTLGLALSYSHKWFTLTIGGMPDNEALVVLRRCEKVLPQLRHFCFRIYDLTPGSHLLSPWSEGCEPVAQRLRSAEVGYLHLPILGGLLVNVVELTVVMESMHQLNPNTNIDKIFRGGHSLRKLTVRRPHDYRPFPDNAFRLELANLVEIRLEYFTHETTQALLRQLNCPNVHTIGLKIPNLYNAEDSAKLFSEVDQRWRGITTLYLCAVAEDFSSVWIRTEMDEFLGNILDCLQLSSFPIPLEVERHSDLSTYKGQVGYVLFPNLKHLHLDLPYLMKRGLTTLFGLITERRRGDSVASIQTLKLSLGGEVIKDQAQVLESLQFYVDDAIYTTRNDATRS